MPELPYVDPDFVEAGYFAELPGAEIAFNVSAELALSLAVIAEPALSLDVRLEAF